MDLQLHQLILRTMHAQNRMVRPYMAELGLTIGQPKVLRLLVEHGGCIQRGLADLCEIEPATMSRLLEGMEAAGLITRTVCPEDKRAVWIETTQVGRELHEKMTARFQEVNALELKGFSPDEARQLYEGLAKVYYNLTGREIV